MQHLLEPVNDQIRHPSAGRDAGEGAGRGSGREQQQQLPDIGCSCPELVRRHGASPHGALAGPARPSAGCLPACLWPRPFGWLLSSRQIQASEGGGWSFPAAAAAAVAALRKQKTTAVGVCMLCQAGARQQLFPAHTSLMQVYAPALAMRTSPRKPGRHRAAAHSSPADSPPSTAACPARAKRSIVLATPAHRPQRGGERGCHRACIGAGRQVGRQAGGWQHHARGASGATD